MKRHRFVRRLLLAAALMLALLGSDGAAAAIGKIYYSDGNRIKRADPDGSNVELLVTVPMNAEVRALALDIAGGKMYFGNFSQRKIQSADLDGSNVQDLVTGAGSPHEIAVDLVNGLIYWTDAQSTIRRANLDGSNAQTVLTTSSFPFEIALDVAGGKMYWSEAAAFSSGKIGQANLDGSSPVDLVTGLRRIWGLALDLSAGKIYWTDLDFSRIRRANLDGSGVQDVVTGLGNVPNGIALDELGGQMYWAESTGPNTAGKLIKANLDGSGVTDVITMQDDHSVALVPAAVEADCDRLLDHFESRTLEAWSFAGSTNGADSGSICPGSWRSSTTFSSLSGNYSATLAAAANRNCAPWRVDASIQRPVSVSFSRLMATLRFDRVQGTNGRGHTLFIARVASVADPSKAISYVYSANFAGAPGDVRYTVSPGDVVDFDEDVAADYLAKYGQSLPQDVTVEFLSSADYAEDASSPTDQVRSIEVAVDDVRILASTLHEDFETGTLGGWSYACSTNGSAQGTVPPGSWITSVTSAAVNGAFSASLLATADRNAAPWGVNACVQKTVNGLAALKATMRFDQVQGTNGRGHSMFLIRVASAADPSKNVQYVFSTNFSPGPGDHQFSVAPGDVVAFERDVAADFRAKHGTELCGEVVLSFRASADYAENASPSDRVRTVEVTLDDIEALAGPGDGVPDASDNCPSIYNPGQQDDDLDGLGNPCDPCYRNPLPDCGFHRGDPNGDGATDISDGVSIFSFLFLGGAAPGCMESADSNNDGAVDISDGIVVLDFLFRGGPPPASPGPRPAPCGPDPDPAGAFGDLGCLDYSNCP